MQSAPPLKLANTWGTIPLGRSRLQVRLVVFWCAALLWVGWTIASTGPKGFISLAYNAIFVVGLMVISRATTTVPLATTGTIVLCGGVMMGIAGSAGLQMAKALGAGNPITPVLQAIFEEVLKLLPVVILLLRGRNFSSLTLGATDIFLLGVASGAGFAYSEDAFVHAAAWQTQIVWLPATEVINGRMVAGHAIWTGLAAGTLGLALMQQKNKSALLVIAPIGFVWALLDHINYNFAFNRTDTIGQVLNILSGNGYITVVLFVACYLAVLFFDRFVLFKTLPKVPEFRIPSSKDAADSLENFWEFVLDRRRLAYAYYRYTHRSGNDKRSPALVVAILMKHLMNCHKVKTPPAIADVTPPLVTMEDIQDVSVIKTKSPGGLHPTLIESQLQSSLSPKNPESNRILDLPERYEALSILSQGGMGVIYKARHVMTGAKLAVKTLHVHLAHEPKHILRFEQEAKAASALKHPHLVVVHDFGLTPSNIPFIVMDLIEGTNLQEQILNYGPLSVKRFCDIFVQASDALAHAHKRGVIHRDIKPANMILAASDDGKDFIRIVDFGIAKVIASDALTTQELTQTGDLVGSPLYMSPEQCLGTALDARSDIYSLGCVMYEAITGKTPFLGPNSVQTIFKHIHEMPPRPSTQRTDILIPPELEKVLFRTLQKDPAGRYALMDDLRTDLEYIQISFN
ncbi:MAG: protein kinase [Cyanobacteria bacterium SZAS-4]|nr:protein kinase [Cyanobacteria bacterium SZAS-4]